MKPIRLLPIALLVGLVLGISACKSEPIIDSEYDHMQYAVTNLVKGQKTNNRVILLVAYGSAWEEAYNAYDVTIDAYKQKFRGYDVFLAFSSNICINNARAGLFTLPRDYYSPQNYLIAFAQDGVSYDEIVVQSLQVIPTKEYDCVTGILKDFANNVNGDLNEEYLSRVNLKLGVPLLMDPDKDVPKVAKELDGIYQDLAADNLIVFMAHGAPEEYDTYEANARFVELEKALQEINPHYFVGTIDVPGNYKTDVYQRMVDAGFNEKNLKVFLHPLLAVNGSRVHDYMFDNESDGTRYNFADLMAEVREGEDIDYYWQEFFGATGSGFICENNTMIQRGLLDLQEIAEIWMSHTLDAISREPLDFLDSRVCR